MADWGDIIGGLIKVGGPLVGKALADKDEAQVHDILNAARDEYGNIQVPKLKEILAKEAQAFTSQDTLLSGIKDDPQYRQQQLEGDAALKNIVDSGGLTLADKAALENIKNKIARQESAGRGAIANEMAQRGTLDSGKQLAMQLANQQNSANAAAQAGLETAGQAQARAYQAILARSKLAGEGLDRDYRQKSAAAAAQDAINRGNADIRGLTSRFNVASGVDAQKFNTQLPMQEFDAGLRRTNASQPANANLASYYGDRGQKTQDTIAQGAKAAGNFVTEVLNDDEEES